MPTGDKQRPTVSIVIVTYQSERYIAPCLSSIHRHADVPCEAIVVDNASPDATRRVVANEFPGTTLLPMEKNRWYTAAANAGVALARGDYVLFLNPDAELRTQALPHLIGHLTSHTEVAAAGPRLISPGGDDQPSAFTYPSLLMTWLEFFPHPGRLLDSRVNGRLSSPDERPIAIDHPLGACMLVRRAAWEDVGPFDEDLVHYCEEVDWCMRAKARGWTVSYVPTAVVVHHGGASTAAAPGLSLEQLYQSRDRLHRKHRGPVFRAAARFITRLGLRQERRRLQRRMETTGASDGTRERLAAIERVLHHSRA